jgi:hypothetical protein
MITESTYLVPVRISLPWAFQQLPTGDQLVEIELEPGREVVLVLRDQTGTAVAEGMVTAEIEGFDPWSADETSTGRFRFEGLPPGLVRFIARVNGQRYEMVHDTNRPAALLTVLIGR